MKIVKFEPKNGMNAKAHRRDNAFMQQYTLVAAYKNGLVEIAQLRIYGTQAKNYACFWTWCGYGDKSTKKHSDLMVNSCMGSGSAGGYGYHRPSAAAQEAFSNAGIKLSEDICGRGDRAMEEALLALGRFLGYRKLEVLVAHA